MLGLASYGQDKLVESAQLCENAGNTSIECSAVVHVILQEIRVCGHQKSKFSLARAETALAKSSFQQGGRAKKGRILMILSWPQKKCKNGSSDKICVFC